MKSKHQPRWFAFHCRTFSWWPPPLRCAHLVPVSKAQIIVRKHTFLSIFKQLSWLKHSCKIIIWFSFFAYMVDAYKVNCTKAAMADLPEISEEFFRIFFEEELSGLGVLQVPRSNSVGHAGWGWAWAAATRDYLGLPRNSPLLWLICRTMASYRYTPKHTKNRWH